MRCLFPQRHKGQHELQYWLQRRSAEGELDNSHYVELYTTRFAISKDFYRGKRILDIGCGPRGSLEWAEMAAERVGLDPLAREYMKLGADRHQMNYVASGAEAMPFPKAYFDVVCSFNSLDHVANLDRTIGEIKRVTKAGGRFLLLTDVNHEPTECEPITFGWDIIDRFTPEFTAQDVKHFEKMPEGLVATLRAGEPYDHARSSDRYGVLQVDFTRSRHTID